MAAPKRPTVGAGACAAGIGNKDPADGAGVGLGPNGTTCPWASAGVPNTLVCPDGGGLKMLPGAGADVFAKGFEAKFALNPGPNPAADGFSAVAATTTGGAAAGMAADEGAGGWGKLSRICFSRRR